MKIDCGNSYNSTFDIGELIMRCITMEELDFLKTHIEASTFKEKNKDRLLTMITLKYLVFPIDEIQQQKLNKFLDDDYIFRQN